MNKIRQLGKYVFLFIVSLLSTILSVPANAELMQADLVTGSGDGLLVRDTDSHLDWLRLTETQGLSVVDVIDDGIGGYAEMGFDLASVEQVEALFFAGGVVEVNTGFVEENFEPVSFLIGLLGCVQGCDGDLPTAQGWVQAPDLEDWVLHGVLQTAACCPPSGRAYVLDVSASPKTTRSEVNGIFLVRPTPTPQALIDILPGKDSNIINLKSGGLVPVAVLTDGEFDALQIDPDTTYFGPNEAAVLRYQIKDVDSDGDVDLLLKFRLQQTGITCSDVEATLNAELYDGTLVTGTDSIQTKNCQ